MSKKQKKVLVRIIVALVLLAGVILLDKLALLPQWAMIVLYLVPYFVIGYDILWKALKGIKNRQVFDENFLMAVATVGALCLQDFKEGVAVMLFYQIGELFQSVAVGKSRKNIAALMDIRPDYANLMVDGKLEQVDPDDVEVGTEIVVDPGEKVPIDGVIVEGNTTLNTGALTGESVPREAKPGDDVISGCINMSGRITVRTTKPFGESTVSKILDLVENSAMKKSKSENFITKFARYYTPAVCYSALALAVLPPLIRLLAGHPAMWAEWITRALTFLVISCPCALVISIPLSFFGGIGCASKNGILVKGSNYLEALADTKYIVCDKTGTLTVGQPQVTSVIATAEVDDNALLALAAAVEQGSSHPLAQAIVREAQRRQLSIPLASGQRALAGSGIEAEVNGSRILICAASKAAPAEHEAQIQQLESAGQTVVLVMRGETLLGILALRDTLRDDARQAVDALHQLGVQGVILTGDNPRAAAAIASELGLEFRAGLLPADKVNAVIALNADAPLAMVGDGINDAPAMKAATIGIAMGSGTDVALETADAALTHNRLTGLAQMISLARATHANIRQNIAIALGLKGIFLVTTLLGLTGLWLAVLADTGATVLVTANALRLLRKKL